MMWDPKLPSGNVAHMPSASVCLPGTQNLVVKLASWVRYLGGDLREATLRNNQTQRLVSNNKAVALSVIVQ